jgi:hypothetical protein
MSEYFDGFFSGPRKAGQNRTLGTTSRPRNHAVKTQHLNEEFFDGFFAGPRAAR